MRWLARLAPVLAGAAVGSGLWWLAPDDQQLMLHVVELTGVLLLAYRTSRLRAQVDTLNETVARLWAAQPAALEHHHWMDRG